MILTSKNFRKRTDQQTGRNNLGTKCFSQLQDGWGKCTENF